MPDAIVGAISSISTELKGHTSTESPKDLLNSAAFSNLRSALDEQPQACSKFFGDDLSTVEMLRTSHERAVEYHAMSDSSQLETGLRDQWMAKAFAFVREANPTMNFFGQLGYAHTMQSPTKTQANTQVGDLDSCMPFATLLNEDSSLSGKICTIQYAYASGDQLADCTSNLDLSDFEPWCGQDTFQSGLYGQPVYGRALHCPRSSQLYFVHNGLLPKATPALQRAGNNTHIFLRRSPRASRRFTRRYEVARGPCTCRYGSHVDSSGIKRDHF